MNNQIQKLLSEINNNSDKKVTVYSLIHCPACNELKEKLEHLNIVYENVDMEGNDEVWKVLREEGGKDYVPQVRVNNKLIHEFDVINDLIGLVITEVVGRKIIIK